MLKEGTKAVVCLSLFSSFGILALQYKGTLRHKVLLFLAIVAVTEQKPTEVNDLAQTSIDIAKYTYLNILTFLFFPPSWFLSCHKVGNARNTIKDGVMAFLIVLVLIKPL